MNWLLFVVDSFAVTMVDSSAACSTAVSGLDAFPGTRVDSSAVCSAVVSVFYSLSVSLAESCVFYSSADALMYSLLVLMSHSFYVCFTCKKKVNKLMFRGFASMVIPIDRQTHELVLYDLFV